MTIPLKARHCVPCEGNTPPLSLTESEIRLEEVNGWSIVENSTLEKTFVWKDFATALRFVNAVGAIAEEEGHHPDILLFGWNKVKLALFTHAIDGLSDNDFILAAKIDNITL